MNRRRGRRFLSINPFKWINANPEKAQAHTNIVSTTVTLFALLITIYYSNKGIRESEISNKNATEQLKLANEQILLSKQEINRSKDREAFENIKQSQKDVVAAIEKHTDSIRLAKNDQFQIESFIQQKRINEQQLKAITKQASTAEAQFNLQNLQNVDIYERNKAVFFPDSVLINKVRLANYLVSFRIINQGNYPAHIDSMLYSCL